MEALSSTEGLSIPAVAVTGVSLLLGLYILYSTLIRPNFTQKSRYWRQLSWVGVRKELFSNLKAQTRSIKGMHTMLEEGYAQFSKKGKAFVVPLFGNDPFVIMPPGAIKELSTLPHDQLNASIPQNQSLQSRYTVGDDISGYNSYHFDVVRRQLTRKLPLMTSDIAEELALGFDDQWGSNKDWTAVKVYPTCMRLVSRAANRVFAGADLCRNAEFLEASKLYSQGAFKAGALIRFVPSVFRPLLGPLINNHINKANLDTALKHSLPVVDRRVQNTLKKNSDPSFDWTPPHDALQWLIEECIATQTDPAELHPRILSRRLLALNMVAIHTTSMGITNTLLDIFSSPSSASIVSALREEATRVLAAHAGVWSKDAINALHRHDSAIRESMRFSALGATGLSRLVVAEKGVDFAGGLHVPRGVTMACALQAMHHDTSFYGADAGSYNPFRFSAPREEYESTLAAARAEGKSEADIRRVLELKNQALITVGSNFLSFGNGLHACPGRFFASQEMKLMLALTVMRYDVRPWATRPKNFRMAAASVPEEDVDMYIRRRDS